MKTRNAPTEQPPPTTAEIMAALDRRINALQSRDADLLNQQLELEGAGVVPAEPSTAPNPRQRALELLNGEKPAHLAGLSQGARLYEIIYERQAIATAIELGQREHLRVEIVRASEILSEHRGAWAEIVRKRVAAILALRAANREALAFKERVGMGLDWPCDPYMAAIFAADCDQYDPVVGFFEQCVLRGFVTAKEIR